MATSLRSHSAAQFSVRCAPRLATLPRCGTITCHGKEARRVESLERIPAQRIRGYARRMRRRRPIRAREIAELHRALEIAALLTTLATRQRCHRERRNGIQSTKRIKTMNRYMTRRTLVRGGLFVGALVPVAGLFINRL